LCHENDINVFTNNWEVFDTMTVASTDNIMSGCNDPLKLKNASEKAGNCFEPP